MKSSHTRLKSSTTTYLALATLIILLGTIFFTINRAVQEQGLRSSAAEVSPPYGGIFTCPGNPACPSPEASQPSPGGASTMPNQIPGQENTNPSIAPVSQTPGTDPCLTGTSLAHGDKKSKHWKHKGNISGFMEALIKFFMELINLLLKLIGGSPIKIPTDGEELSPPNQAPQVPNNPDPNNPNTPQQPNPVPCEPNEVPSTAPSMGTQPSTTVPSTVPSGTAPSGTPGGGNGDPTAATCGGSANTPSSPVTGYTINKCEDFNGTSMPAGWGAYDGGGEGTVVGLGRKPENCTFGNGVVTLEQEATGATCGMSSDWRQTHGYYEARMRAYTTGVGVGSAPHPVLLLWPDSDNWSEGELDWVETDIGSDGIGVFFHCTNGNPAENCFHATHNVDITQWHVYGFEWTATSLKGFVDGVQIYETDGEGGNPTTSFHQTIQLDNNTGQMPPNPGKMEVDWIHMYSK